MTFIETIKEALEAHGKTQREMAEYIGITESAMSLKIRYKRPLMVDEFFKICWFLHIEPNELFDVYRSDLTK